MAMDAWQKELISLIFDYIIGYGCIALVSFFAKKIFSSHSKHIINILWLILSIVLISAIRVVSSSVGGYILHWAPTLASSLWTNLTVYVGWDCLLALVVSIILYPSILLINKRFPTSFTKSIE